MPELLDAGPSRRGWHRLQTVLQCPRKYAIYTRDKAQPRPTTAPALIKGTLLHIGLAHRYALIQDPDADVYEPLKAVEGMAAKQPNPEVWAEHVPLVQETLLQYDVRWGHEQWEVKAVERELVAHIEDKERGEVYLYTQRADLVVLNPLTGLWYIVDHKTSVRPPSSSAKAYSLSGQFRGYNMFGRGLLGFKNFGGVVLNMLQWPGAKKPAEFARLELSPAPFADKTFQQTIIHAERTIRDLTKLYTDTDALAWPGVHHEHACWTRYGPCKHHKTCEWGPDQ